MNQLRHSMILGLLAFPLLSTAAGFTITTGFEGDEGIDITLPSGNTLCIGMDCVSTDAIGDNTIKLKENNTRIGFLDTSAVANIETREYRDSTYVDGLVGNMWYASANESANGCANLFSFDMVSTEEYPVLSDGTLIRYDCTTLSDPFTPETPFLEDGVIPEGESAEGTNCQPVPDRTVSQRWLGLGSETEAGVHLGGSDTPSEGTISLGSLAEDKPKRLANLAASLEESSVLLKKTLDNYDLGSELGLDQLKSQLDAIEQGVEALETAAAENADTDSDTDNPFQGLFNNLGNDAKTGSSAFGPLGLLLLAPLLWFRRR